MTRPLLPRPLDQLDGARVANHRVHVTHNVDSGRGCGERAAPILVEIRAATRTAGGDAGRRAVTAGAGVDALRVLEPQPAPEDVSPGCGSSG